ncbi:DHS-like NAD/FAD-binding domain-containing protein [Dothidotthia symphoricarpi CBS 119687]|uniref:DHS-like NAD/FAD-binding domain-containing protein n=1 Tax=Dothidotthia symphoricarpi CBS 119687 TaxID=1392245 RepID=A0A6A6AK83_9PLEO|nr:DHS-like NAD/FAD-binding domain-containing protein [Dothidotthia symphoricarpi CBS 119687]KAF2131643.1 DHS-like NAD/FAD-binding domain-containing protein [Dothidotthia symphoricarpi CBS 119687]
MAYRAPHGEPSSPLSSLPPSSPRDDAASDSELSEPPESSPEPEQSFAKRRPYPSPAKRRSYPSPSSSRRSSAKTSPAPENMPSPPPSNDEDPRPSKKRKLTDPKERTTEYLDLSGDVADEDMPQLARLLKVLHTKRKIVVIAGAGISVSAGIPDFRSATGLFNTLKKDHKLKSSGKDLFDASVYQDDTSTSTFHDMVRTLSQQTKSAQPTAFHQLLATLAQEGRLMRLYTQNVDGIDTSLPPLNTQAPLPKKAPWPKTIQVHGGLDHMVCSKCNVLSPFESEIFSGPTPPSCPKCEEEDNVRLVAEKRSHGIGRLRPRMVLYNEHNPDDEAIGSCATTDIRLRPDAVIVAGTTLKVPGVRRIAREMCKTVRDRRDGVAVWINNDPEPLGKDLEDAWDLVVKGPCDEVARHANMRKWDDPMDYKEVSEEDMKKAKERQRADVVIGTPRKMGVLRNAGHLTPGQSPRVGARMMLKQEPTTPSKNRTKRKAGTQMDLFGKLDTKLPAKAPGKRQPKKATGTKGKAKKDVKKDTPAINNVFRASKNTTRPAAKLLDKTSNPMLTTLPLLPIQSKSENDNDTIHVEKRPTPATPKRRTRLTKLKDGIMVPLSDADPRNNCSPRGPTPEPFTPRGSPVKTRTSGITTPSKQLQEEAEFAFARSSTSDSRPSTAHSERDMIVKPGSVPHGMNNILC